MYNFTILNNCKKNIVIEPIKLNVVSHEIDYIPKALLIHLHGFGSYFQKNKEYIYTFQYKIDKLKGLNIISYGLELRGHGESDGLQYHINCFDEYVSDVHILVCYLKKKYPSLPIFLTGESMGGGLAIIYSLKYKHENNIKGLGLFAPMIGIDLRLPPIILFLFNIISYIAPLWEIVNTNSINRMNIPEYKNYNNKYHFDKKAKLCTSRECLAAMKKIEQNSSNFDFPIIIFHSKYDKITSSKLSKHFIDNCKSNDKEFVELDLDRHLIINPTNKYDHDPDKIYEQFNIWLKKHI
jgi:alpha-beta hydrolase superfamily lysophospholipase